MEAEVLVDEISPSALVSMLQQYVWSSPNYSDHIGVDNLWELMTRNVYLHRLKSKDVLIKCIAQGVSEGKFGYAETYNNEEYKGMCFGKPMSYPSSTDPNLGLLVTPEMAQLVIEEGVPIEVPDPPPIDPPEKPPIDPPDPIPPTGPKRIVVTKTTQNDISLDDINQLREEIIRNLSADGGEVTVKITITANKPEGFSESTARAMRENSAQLDLDFEQS